MTDCPACHASKVMLNGPSYVRCVKAPGRYWFSPYRRISEMLTVGQIYEVRDIGYYSEYSWPGRYLIATRYGSKNFPSCWFEPAVLNER